MLKFISFQVVENGILAEIKTTIFAYLAKR